MSEKKTIYKGQSLAERMAKKLENSQTRPARTPEAETEGTQKASVVDIISGQQANVDMSVIFIDLELIDVEAQIRDEFNQNYIEDLATDFATNPTYQPNQPITVWRREGGRYLLDDGENRYRAMRFAMANRKALGVEDITVFTKIRATVRTDEPSKLERIQSQCKANLLRDDLSPLEIAKAAEFYLKEYSNGTHAEIAKWIGFQKLSSGRVKVSNSLKLANKCDADLVEFVRVGEISMNTAFGIQEERRREKSTASESSSQVGEGAQSSTSEAQAKLNRAKSGKKSVRVSVELEALKTAARIIKLVAEQYETSTELFDDMERKNIVKLFKEENLMKILGSTGSGSKE